jgi:two-component system phosphate regulon sensor histidine kinase PhoR
VTRIADLIENTEEFVEEPGALIVSGDMPIQQVVRAALDAGADSLGVILPDCEKPVSISKAQLLELMLQELDTIQKKVNELQSQLEHHLADQVELMEVGAACLLEARKNKLESAVHNLLDGMILLNENGQVEHCNQVACRLLGLSSQAAPNDVAEALAQLGCADLLQNSKLDDAPRGEFQVKSKTQQLLRIRWSRIRDEWQHPVGTALYLRDITDEVSAENTKNEFITAISHELRTPLTSIQNAVSNILAGVTGKVAGKTKQYLQSMQQDCRRFADLINDLLDMAKLEAGNMPISPKVMDLEALIRITVKEFEPEAQKAGITLSAQTPQAITPVYADIKRIRQVLANLIRNAIQYTPAGGRVTVSLKNQDSHIVTSVQDTGVGIPPEIQKYIFTKFYQVARQAGPGFKGSGLGLAICKGIVQIHGGSIWFESAPAKGSTFFFSLPKADPKFILQKHLESLPKPDQLNRPIALLLIRFESSKPDVSIRDAAGTLISDLLAQSRFYLTDSADLALQTAEAEITFVINESKSQKINNIRKKIEKMIYHSLKKNFSDLPILPMMGMAGCPADTKNAAQLPEIARIKISSMDTPIGPSKTQ